jgi:hypothetical protein
VSDSLVNRLEKVREHLIKESQIFAQVAIEMAIEEINQLNTKIQKLQKKQTRLEDKINHLEKEQV